MDKSRYSGEIRVRSCGILIEDGKILLVQLHSPVTDDWIWIPPGGKVQFGESTADALKREFKEETGLDIVVKDLLYTNELIQNDIHAVEFFYLISRTGGKLKVGTDPEMGESDQIIRDLKFFDREELASINVVPQFIASELWEIPELS